MRISDWSSDVCSSDLNSALVLDVGLSTAMDDVAAAREIAEHVVGLGHRTIAIIMGDPAHAASAQRLVGYRQAFDAIGLRSEEHTSELQSLMRISYAVFCLKKKKKIKQTTYSTTQPTHQ